MKRFSINRFESGSSGCDCGAAGQKTKDTPVPLQPLSLPLAGPADVDAPCCGPKPAPPSSPHAKPGYRIEPFVAGFFETPVGFIPRIETGLSALDITGTFRARVGIYRDRYKVAPGLYCAGSPGKDSPVLVTANYKLSFDSLRKELGGLDVWMLVLDTRGVNVWCAAGKKTFSTEEVIRQVVRVGLEKLVSHRELILPQLGAPGISAHKVRKGCGFKVIWGPVKAGDLPTFLKNGRKAEKHMRQLTFTMAERLVLIPVELSLIVKPSLAIILAVFILSGIGPDIFSLPAAWFRGLNGAGAYLLGVLAGAVLVPTFLPFLPSRRFYVKGILTGLTAGIIFVFLLGNNISGFESLTLLLLTASVSSYAAMNFTGATPFTSPSGVEKEMRQGIPVQIVSVLVALVAWIAAPFIG